MFNFEKVFKRKGHQTEASVCGSKGKEYVFDRRNTLKREHLREGVPAIMTAILTEEDFAISPAVKKIRESGDFVDYYGDPRDLEEKKMINNGYKSYVISACNENDKYSKRYKNCTSLLLVGTGENGREISVLSHQKPDNTINISESLQSLDEKYEHDLRSSIREFIGLTESGTRDVVIFGGTRTHVEQHIASVQLLGSVCDEELGFQPVVITGPKDYRESAAAYFDTQKRRLYFVRPEQDPKNNNSFMPSQLDEQEWVE